MGREKWHVKWVSFAGDWRRRASGCCVMMGGLYPTFRESATSLTRLEKTHAIPFTQDATPDLIRPHDPHLASVHLVPCANREPARHVVRPCGEGVCDFCVWLSGEGSIEAKVLVAPFGGERGAGGGGKEEEQEEMHDG